MLLALKAARRSATALSRCSFSNSLIFDADGVRVGEYMDRWLVDSVRGTVRPTTYERYEQIVRTHIRPVLGSVKLKDITPAHARGLYREKLEAGLSPRTVQYVHVALHKALKQAVQDGLVLRREGDDDGCDEGGRRRLGGRDRGGRGEVRGDEEEGREEGAQEVQL